MFPNTSNEFQHNICVLMTALSKVKHASLMKQISKYTKSQIEKLTF